MEKRVLAEAVRRVKARVREEGVRVPAEEVKRVAETERAEEEDEKRVEAGRGRRGVGSPQLVRTLSF